MTEDYVPRMHNFALKIPWGIVEHTHSGGGTSDKPTPCQSPRKDELFSSELTAQVRYQIIDLESVRITMAPIWMQSEVVGSPTASYLGQSCKYLGVP